MEKGAVGCASLHLSAVLSEEAEARALTTTPLHLLQGVCSSPTRLDISNPVAAPAPQA